MHRRKKALVLARLLGLALIVLLLAVFAGLQLAFAETAPKFRWGERFAPQADPFEITLDRGGNCYVTGQVGDDPLVIGTNVIDMGAGEILLAKFDRTGALSWAIRDGASWSVAGWGVAADQEGNVAVL